jgi:hypothetical protein
VLMHLSYHTQGPVRGLLVFSRGATQHNLSPAQVAEDFLQLGEIQLLVKEHL